MITGRCTKPQVPRKNSWVYAAGEVDRRILGCLSNYKALIRHRKTPATVKPAGYRTFKCAPGSMNNDARPKLGGNRLRTVTQDRSVQVPVPLQVPLKLVNDPQWPCTVFYQCVLRQVDHQWYQRNYVYKRWCSLSDQSLDLGEPNRRYSYILCYDNHTRTPCHIQCRIMYIPCGKHCSTLSITI